MSGGCFSISSLGGIGGAYFTPIINAPGLDHQRVQERTEPRWDGKRFVPRLILPLSLHSGPPRDRQRGGGASTPTSRPSLADFRRVL